MTRGTKRKVARTALAAVTIVGLFGVLLGPGVALAHDRGPICRTVYGHYASDMLPPDQCTSPVGMCTAGALTGALHGSYGFVMNKAIPAGEPEIPGVTFYTGVSHIDRGLRGSIVGIDAGSIDLSPVGTGKQAALITLTGGSDRYETATGYLLLRGTLDPFTGHVTGDYQGEICF